jgi:hypothetical protein
MSVQSSEFEELEGGRGGAVEIEGGVTELLQIMGCRFKSNKASEGGSIYAENVLLLISESVFTNNSAVKLNPVLAYSSNLPDNVKGSGGAIAFLHSDVSTNCSLSITFSRFTDNLAEVKGGAVAWKGSGIVPSLLSNVIQAIPLLMAPLSPLFLSLSLPLPPSFLQQQVGNLTPVVSSFLCATIITKQSHLTTQPRQVCLSKASMPLCMGIQRSQLVKDFSFLRTLA